ncbi:MAG: hypothetical protein QM266_01190 [Bacillota bacterium]|jgi:hypothetical protein|nr:hypothetical protein [Bacillota bacterium]
MKKLLVLVLLLVLVGCGSNNSLTKNLLEEYQGAYQKFSELESYSSEVSNELVVNTFDEKGKINVFISTIDGKFVFTKFDAYSKFVMEPQHLNMESWFSDGKQFLDVNGDRYAYNLTYQEYLDQIYIYTQLKPIDLIDKDIESVLNESNAYNFKLTEAGANKLYESNDIFFDAVMSESFIKESVKVDKYKVTIEGGNIVKLEVFAIVNGKLNDEDYEIEYSETIDYYDLNTAQVKDVPNEDDFITIKMDPPVTDGIVVTNLNEFKDYLTSIGFVTSDDDIYTLALEDVSYSYKFSTQTHFMVYQNVIYEYYWDTDTGRVNDCVADFKLEVLSESCTTEDFTNIENARKSFFYDIDYLGITDYSILK